MHPDEYTPYGQRQVYTQGWLMSDLNGDGVVDSADESIVSAGSDPAADLDGDGDIDSADIAIVQADLGQALPASDPLVTHPAAMSFRGDLAQTAGVALCPVGHQGLIHDEELGTSGGGSLIYNRARHLHPRLGRFMQRDPLGYVDGMSVYAYLNSRPTVLTDPLGLVADDEMGELLTKFEDWRSEAMRPGKFDHLDPDSVEYYAAKRLMMSLMNQMRLSALSAAARVGWSTGKDIAAAHPALAPFVVGIDATLAASQGWEGFLEYAANEALGRIRSKGNAFVDDLMVDLGVEDEAQLLRLLKQAADEVTPAGSAATKYFWNKERGASEFESPTNERDCYGGWYSLGFRWKAPSSYSAWATGEYCFSPTSGGGKCCYRCHLIYHQYSPTITCRKVSAKCD